jgi:hypothetical protein
MTNNYNGEVIYYSPLLYKVAILAAVVLAVTLFMYGQSSNQPIFLGVSLFCVVFAGLFSWSVKNKLKPGAIALANKEGMLVGNELNEPLTIAETTFETKSDYEGGWVIKLYSKNKIVTLGAGGWRTATKSRLTKNDAAQILQSFGLKQHGG